MYAWSRIIYGAEKDDEGNYLGPKAVEVGDDVDQSTLGVSDEEWQLLQDQGVVRDQQLPEDLRDPFRSPRQLMQDKLTAAQQGFDQSGLTDDLLRRFDDEGNVITEEEISPEGNVTPVNEPAPTNGGNQESGLPQ